MDKTFATMDKTTVNSLSDERKQPRQKDNNSQSELFYLSLLCLAVRNPLFAFLYASSLIEDGNCDTPRGTTPKIQGREARTQRWNRENELNQEVKVFINCNCKNSQ